MLYKAVLNGSYGGQDIRNILYYRTGPGVDVSALGMSGALQLAEVIGTDIWPYMKPVVDNTYSLNSIDVYPYNDAFTLVYQNPLHFPINETGAGAFATMGPAACLNIVFSLEPTMILQNGIKPPKRGYFALSCFDRALVTEGGMVDNAVLSNQEHPLNVFAMRLANNIENLLPLPIAFYPIRVRQKRGVIDNLIPFESWADIDMAQVSPRMSFRRSRMPEL